MNKTYADFPFDFDEKTNFVGLIAPGERGTAVFTLEVDSDAVPKTYLLKLQTRSVSRGNVLVSEHSVSVKVGEPEKGNPSFLWQAL